MEEIAGRCQEDVYCNKGYRSKKLHENLQCKIFTPGESCKLQRLRIKGSNEKMQ